MIDINSIPKDLRDELINVFTLPLWYISLYIYCPSVYNKGDLLLSISLCISLALISTIITNISIQNMFPDNKKGNELSLIFSFLFQTIWLSLLIFLGYLFTYSTGIIFEFYGFLITYFCMYPIFSVYYHIRKAKKGNK